MSNDSNSYCKTHERIHRATVGVVGVECVDAGSSGPRLVAGGASYLESVRKDCGDDPRYEVLSEEYEVRACGCRSWFCPHCCLGRGLSLRERLLPILRTFTGLLMWTFTVDPTLFASPAAAFKYVREKRCISETMRKLRRMGFLHSGRYFYVVEWQRDTEMAHFHVLCDASFIPFEAVCSIWNRFRPASAGPVQGQRPGFGSVRFSAPKFADASHAANYACAYLIKYPMHGYPDWVEDSTDQIHRYAPSRGFWRDSQDETPSESTDVPEVEEIASDEDCCPVCGHEGEGTTDHCDKCGWSVLAEPVEVQKSSPEVARTIRERRERCCTQSVLLRVRKSRDRLTGTEKAERKFIRLLDGSIGMIAETLGRELDELPRCLPLTRIERWLVQRKFATTDCRQMD